MILLKVKTKLKSQSGVSILFALLAFMVAAMVSATVIAAASSASKRVYSDQAQEQERLTLVSAAQLIRDEMAQTQLSETKKVTRTENADGTYSDSTTVTTGGTGTFATEMQAAVEYVDTYDTDYDSENSEASGRNFQISASGTDFSMDGVNVSFKMSAEDTYKLVFTLSLDGSNQTVYLIMTKPKGTTEHNVSGNVTTDKQTISWNKDNAVIRGTPE